MSNNCRMPLSPQQMMAKSREDTGIGIVDDEVVDALTVLVTSLNDEGDMFETGAIELQKRILHMLKNRLRMFRDFQAHPEILDLEVKAPIMISGTLRTGSTKLQSVLSASEDFNWLTFWKVYNFASRTGMPNEDTAERIAEVEEYLAYNRQVSPEINAIHLQATYAPEEETLIAMQTLRTPSWFGYGNIPSYMEWVAGQDPLCGLKFTRDALKYLQWQGLADPEKRWLLKSPFYFGFEDAVKSVFPDASFIATHRPPADSLPSLFSLLEALIRCHANNAVGDPRMTMAGQMMTTERHVEIREAHPDMPVLDIHFKEAVGDIEGVVRKIYRFADEKLSDQSLHRMLSWENENPMHKHGTHKYALSDYGISEDEITQLCPSYTAFYAKNFASM